MKLTAQVKLVPTPEQAALLKQTLETANAACNAISAYAWDNRVFNQFALHKVLYATLRDEFKLAAQVVVRCLGKVADAYKLDKKTKRAFKPHGSIPYDNRILNYRQPTETVSIWVLSGRETMPYQCGDRQRELLKHQKGESDLWYTAGTFYLLATCEIDEPTPEQVETFLGVDGGIVNIATDSDGEVHRAEHINHVRYRQRRLRKNLQKKGTQSARRRLRKLSGKEYRFARDTNHCISKRIVAKAQDTKRGSDGVVTAVHQAQCADPISIALEDLAGIRDRLTVRKSQRATLHSWSFDDLQQKIRYKARRAGVPVVYVDPRNTSRTCPRCGCIDRHNRPSQSRFCCVACGFSGLADHIAAVNISRRAAVNPPHVPDATDYRGSARDKLPDLSGSR